MCVAPIPVLHSNFNSTTDNINHDIEAKFVGSVLI